MIPYVTSEALYQIEYAKAGQQLGIPIGVPVFSWDNLSTKGAIHVVPDRLFVWNEAQKREAVSLHKMPSRKVVITGGMRFSRFFKATVRFSRDEFCRRFGLDPSKPMITYLGSSRTIAPEEHLFLWRWIEALRSCDVPQVMACNVFVRPHPMNNAIWDQWPKECPRNIGVWDGSDNDVRGVIDCVSHSVAVVGVNTTAMLEAAALGKPVLTVLDDAVRAGQAERIHFDHLTSVAGGLVTAARDFDEACFSSFSAPQG